MKRNGENNVVRSGKSKKSLEIDIEREIARLPHSRRWLGKGMIKAKDEEAMCWK